ncbi:unnamed protein product [Vitrella brassicaformis CCMP3155]|uniref:Uncharacterized protein n=1 Tax=Vitrella brassicaformis (strain CCMP3155) TaxID=1169540 RepID=A0A0G4F9J2_VITBC|nr:unnamed protein product [Vitrella brassicaformis CCMP3155]|eukprot:CEM09589.1 unnamed protein product [Vitrella brassicaformis CCMP3155]
MAKRHCPRQEEEDVDGMLVDDDDDGRVIDSDDMDTPNHGQQSSLPLWTVPSDTISTFLSPLLGTQCIIGTLSLVRKAFHTIAAEPSTHLCVHIHTAKAIHLTGQQLSVWLTRLSKTKRAVLFCPVTESITSLVEGTSNTLTYLEMDHSHSERHGRPRLLSERQGASLVEFPVLEEARVGGDWAQAAPRKRWALRSLVSLSVRDCRLLVPVIGFGVWWRSFAPALRSFEYDDDGCWSTHPYPYDTLPLQELLRVTTSVPDLSALKVLRLEIRSCFTHGGAQLLAQRDLRLEEVDIALSPEYLSTQDIENVDDFRQLCLAPNVTENWSRSDFWFRLESLYDSSGMSSEVLRSCAGTIKTLASVPTEVSMSTHLTGTGVSHLALYGLVPSLVFSRARTLTVESQPSDGPPLAEIVLSHVPHLFPCVTRAEALVDDMSDALVQRVLGQLPMLEAVLLETTIAFSEESEDETWLRVDQTDKDRPFAERAREATKDTWVYWEQGDTEGSVDFESCQEIAWWCVRATHHLSCLESIFVNITVEGDQGWEQGQAGGDIARVLQECLTHRPGTPPDALRVPFHLLLREYGFEMVELPHVEFDCRVEVRRLGLPVPSQKRITDYFSVARQ